MTQTDTPNPNPHTPAEKSRRIDTENDFRWVLRSRTRDSHERLDAMISTLDLAEREDLIRFFQLHLMCFEAMAEQVDHAVLQDLIDRLRLDLDALGPEIAFPAVAMGPFHPLAAEYIIAGSRMGTVVLRKAWAAATDPDVMRADAYFSAPEDRDAWPAVSARLSAIASDGDEAQRIVRDTEAIFDGFVVAFGKTGPRHAA